MLLVMLAPILLAVSGCAKERESAKGDNFGVIQSAHHWGDDCGRCHTDWNLTSIHDQGSAAYNSDCIKCHGNKLDEQSLNANVPAIHAKMMKYVLREIGKTAIDNDACTHCHKSVDFLGNSAGNIRKQVASQSCADCHGQKGPGKPLYIE